MVKIPSDCPLVDPEAVDAVLGGDASGSPGGAAAGAFMSAHALSLPKPRADAELETLARRVREHCLRELHGGGKATLESEAREVR